MKKTAVDWLVNEMPVIDWQVPYWKIKLDKAKAMEKEQIIDANIAGMEFIPVDPNRHQEDAEHYYNETFNINKE